jgi:hypothetical protein
MKNQTNSLSKNSINLRHNSATMQKQLPFQLFQGHLLVIFLEDLLVFTTENFFNLFSFSVPGFNPNGNSIRPVLAKPSFPPPQRGINYPTGPSILPTKGVQVGIKQNIGGPKLTTPPIIVKKSDPMFPSNGNPINATNETSYKDLIDITKISGLDSKKETQKILVESNIPQPDTFFSDNSSQSNQELVSLGVLKTRVSKILGREKLIIQDQQIYSYIMSALTDYLRTLAEVLTKVNRRKCDLITYTTDLKTQCLLSIDTKKLLRPPTVPPVNVNPPSNTLNVYNTTTNSNNNNAPASLPLAAQLFGTKSTLLPPTATVMSADEGGIDNLDRKRKRETDSLTAGPPTKIIAVPSFRIAPPPPFVPALTATNVSFTFNNQQTNLSLLSRKLTELEKKIPTSLTSAEQAEFIQLKQQVPRLIEKSLQQVYNRKVTIFYRDAIVPSPLHALQPNLLMKLEPLLYQLKVQRIRQLQQQQLQQQQLQQQQIQQQQLQQLQSQTNHIRPQ